MIGRGISVLDIDKLRDEIDDIDKQIIELFEKRMDVVLNLSLIHI